MQKLQATHASTVPIRQGSLNHAMLIHCHVMLIYCHVMLIYCRKM
jgi:hypothetical protein